MKKVLATVLLGLSCMFSFAQEPEWVQLMQDPNAKFEDTRAAFEAYFANRPTGKGTGWKQFKRWEYFMSSRLDENGRQTGPLQTLKEMEAYYATHPMDRRNSTTGNWTEMGPVYMPANGTGQPNGLGRITSIAFHPTNANTFIIGSPSGGLWRSTDNGSSWNDLSTGLTRLGVSSIVYHPSTPSTIYIGTGDRDAGDAPGYGVWRSTDSGNTWSAHNTGMGNRTVNEVIMHPSNANIMIAVTNNRIYRTTDGGANWTQTFTGHNCKDIAFKPGDPNIVYAAGSLLYRSSDNGQTWTQITSGVPAGVSRIALAVSANQPDYVYLFTGNGSGFSGFCRSTDSGLNFTTRSTTPNICGYDVTGGTGSQAWYDLVAVADPANADHIFTGAINIWESFDGGVNWSISSHWVGSGGNPAVHADIHSLDYSPLSGELYAGCDGGVYRTSDGGATWPEISSGLAIAQVYKIGVSQQSEGHAINGYQDNGTAFIRNGSWFTEIGGDGMECIIDYSDDQVMYGALYYGDVRRSTNGGASFTTIAENGVNGINESGGWVTPYKLHPSNPDTMYIGYKNIWRSYNCKSAAAGSVTWTRISTFAGSSNIVDLAVAPSNPDVMYVARSGTNKFYVSTNVNTGSPTWTDLTASLPSASTPKDIEINPTNPNNLWIALNNDIYESNDGGNTWTAYDGTLPSISLNTIVYDKRSTNDALYVGMDVGVYYRDNTMPDWTLFSTGLPNVEVTELEIYYDPECAGNDKLLAATYGRGLWESDLMDPGNVAPIACFRANVTEVCVGQTVMLEDLSAYTPTSWSWSISPATHTYVNSTSATSQNPQVQFTAVGLYTVTLNSTNVNGTDNDTRTSYINVTGSAISLPVTEDFESMGLCGTASDCGTTTCALANGWSNWTNGSADDIDWRIDEGGTPSANTGPSNDYNPGTATGNYAYTEASGCYGQTAIMESMCLDLTSATNPEITFAYHLFGADMGELHLDVLSNGAWVPDVMTVITGDQGNSWNTRTVSLAAYSGEVVKIRFRGITGANFTSDMAIDDINIVNNAFPVLVTSFTGQPTPAGNKLQWAAEGTVDGESFILEKQLINGFEVIHTQAATPGTYSFTDQKTVKGANIYRLRVVDLNGQTHYEGQVEIWVDEQHEFITLYPNPAKDVVNIEISMESSDVAIPIHVTDVLGRRAIQQELKYNGGHQVYQLDISGLSQGVWFVTVGEEVFRLVKE